MTKKRRIAASSTEESSDSPTNNGNCSSGGGGGEVKQGNGSSGNMEAMDTSNGSSAANGVRICLGGLSINDDRRIFRYFGPLSPLLCNG